MDFSYLDIRIWSIATFIRSPKISWTVTVRFSVTVGIGNGFQFFIRIWPKNRFWDVKFTKCNIDQAKVKYIGLFNFGTAI
jgi:hypothetical protein